LWYDILFEYDKTKTYQEQKYGASISDAVPQIIKDEEKLDKCFEVGVTYNPEMFTGIISVYRFFMFSRELKHGDSIVIRGLFLYHIIILKGSFILNHQHLYININQS